MIGILLLTAAAQAADSSLPIMRAQVRAPLAGYFSRDDYPASARARREEGEVAVQLTIGNDGRVIGCAVLATTASSTLANTTCRILRSRSRFTPAHDATGRPVTDAGQAVIRWSLAEGPRTVQDYLPGVAANLPSRQSVLPGGVVEPARSRANLPSYVSAADYPASAAPRREQGTVAFTLDIAPDGRVTNCAVTGSSGSSTLDNTTCRLMRSRARFTPARDRNGNPVGDTVSSSITWRLPQSAPVQTP